MFAQHKNALGFSLIELMIVVAIVGILGAIAYPSYNSHMHTSRRTDAQRIMISHAQSMERYFTSNGKYVSSGTTCGPSDPTATAYYTFSNSCTATTFTITASPVTSSGQPAGDQTLSNTGARTGTWKN